MGILSFFRRRQAKGALTPEASAGTRDRGKVETPRADVSKDTVPTTGARATVERSAEISVAAALLEPVVTEKSALLASIGDYTFRVASGATKQDVWKAVEGQFRVHVTGVRMVTIPPKIRRRGRTVGEVSGYRKAIVSLKAGEQIDLAKEIR